MMSCALQGMDRTTAAHETRVDVAKTPSRAVGTTVPFLLGAVVAWMLALLLIAIFVPYHGTDALVYGSWSERIAQFGGLRTPDVSNAFLHRPLFYGGQGLLWGVFGIHEWIGRLWSWLFMAVFLAGLMRLAAGWRRDLLAAAFAGLLALAIPDVAVQAAAGQTDVPVAALVTLSAALVWTVAPTPLRTAGVVAAVAAAALTKPSAFPAIAGLAAATLIGPPSTWRLRVLRDTLPIVAGVVVALIYHEIQARYLGQSLYDFLSGTADDPAAAATIDAAFDETFADARRTVVVAAQWLGPYVAVLALFSTIYAGARTVGMRHRLAGPATFVLAILLAWLLPYLGQSGARSIRVGPLEAGQPGALIAFVLLLVPLWLFSRLPEDRTPSRALLARMLVWTIPMVVAWIHLSPSETRYLSAAWAPLVVLMASVLTSATRSVTTRTWVVPVALLATPVVLVALNLRNIDSLGTRPDGTRNALRALSELRPSDLGHPERMRALADPQLTGLLNDGRTAVGPQGRLLTDDGRLVFFFLDRIIVRNPTGCADMRGFDGVALLGNLATPQLDLARCEAPRASIVRAVPGSYAVYAVR